MMNSVSVPGATFWRQAARPALTSLLAASCLVLAGTLARAQTTPGDLPAGAEGDQRSTIQALIDLQLAAELERRQAELLEVTLRRTKLEREIFQESQQLRCAQNPDEPNCETLSAQPQQTIDPITGQTITIPGTGGGGASLQIPAPAPAETAVVEAPVPEVDPLELLLAEARAAQGQSLLQPIGAGLGPDSGSSSLFDFFGGGGDDATAPPVSALPPEAPGDFTTPAVDLAAPPPPPTDGSGGFGDLPIPGGTFGAAALPPKPEATPMPFVAQIKGTRRLMATIIRSDGSRMQAFEGDNIGDGIVVRRVSPFGVVAVDREGERLDFGLAPSRSAGMPGDDGDLDSGGSFTSGGIIPGL